MAEVVASMTVTISTDWSNWMKGLDGSEQWRKLLHSFCNERCIGVVHNDNIILLSGNFEAIKDVRRFLQDAAKNASEKMEKDKEEKEKMKREKREKEKKEERIKIYERKASISPTTGLEENCEQMKIAEPEGSEGTEKRVDTKQKRVRTLKVTQGLTKEVKLDDVIGNDDVGSDTHYHHDSSTGLIKMRVDQNQATESQMLDDRLVSLDDKMTSKTEQQRNDLDYKLNNGTTQDSFQRQMPQIHESPHQGQTQRSIYPPLSSDQVSANAGQMAQPIYTASDQGQTVQYSHPSQGQRQPAGHQGQLGQHGYTSHAQGQVAGHQAQTNHLGYSSQDHEQETEHKGQMEEQSHPPQGHGQATGLQGHSMQQAYPSQDQGHATGLQGQTVQQSYPSQDQGHATGLQGQTAQQSYPSQDQGHVAQHQAQIQQASYSSQGHMTNYQGILQPFVNPVNPGHSNPLPHMYKQFIIKHAGNDFMYFTSNRLYNVLNIFVHKGNIVDQRTQVLVSSANSQLTTHGSVSEGILKAAGKSVVDECSQIITTRGFLPFGTVISTKAGNLAPHVETILHAVIPTPQQLQKDPLGSFDFLVYAFLNTLYMSSGHTKSVSIPAIGSEIFGLQRMVEAFTFALQRFDQDRALNWHFRFLSGDIHLISNDPNKLMTILHTLWPLVA